jgi:hypothetical protein
MVTDTNMKQLENSKETLFLSFVGNMYCNIPAAAYTSITIKGKYLNCRRL